MIDINELRQSLGAIRPEEVAELLDRLEAAEKERDFAKAEIARLHDDIRELTDVRVLDEKLGSELNAVAKERDALRAKVAEMEKQEPVGVLHVGSYYGEELQDWEFEANQCACDKLNEAYVRNPMSLPLYALPGAQAQPAKNAVAYLDLGTGGYMDVGTDLTDEELATLPKGRHMLGIIGTYGVDGYVPAQPAPSVPDGFSREDLEAVADGLDGYEKTVNVGNVTGGGDDHLESTTAYAARFIRAMLAAAPEAKL